MKNLLSLLGDYLEISKPWWWVMNHPYSPAWDAEARRLLSHGVVPIRDDDYYARFGPYRLWVANYPYACFHPVEIQVRPSRLTMLRMHRLLKAAPTVEHEVKNLIRQHSQVVH